MRLQWIVTSPEGQEFLVTYYESSDEYIEVAPRVNHTRWGQPFTCRPLYEHTGTLISGEITCSCGWRSGHYALASDADEAFTQHIKDADE